MNTPNLPTDNLYKFLALLGLFITFVPLVTLTIDIEKSTVEHAKSNTISAQLGQEAGRLESALDRENEIAPEDIQEFQDRLYRLIDKYNELELSLSISEAKISNTKSRIKTFKLTSFFGIFLTFLGFYFWYNRTQKPNDEILKLEKEKRQKQFSKENQ